MRIFVASAKPSFLVEAWIREAPFWNVLFPFGQLPKYAALDLPHLWNGHLGALFSPLFCHSENELKREQIILASILNFWPYLQQEIAHLDVKKSAPNPPGKGLT